MPTLMYLGQVPAQWLTEAGNAALSGGKIAFYEVGTTTPKDVFADYQGITSAGTVITLDSAGRADVFLSGLYRVQLTDSNDVPIGNHIDGIGSAVSSDASNVVTVETYADLRGFDGSEEKAIVVQGRLANGDGGAGLFVWDALETMADDDGSIITTSASPVSGRWIRVRGRYIDPRWYGCVMDGVTDDSIALGATLGASLSLKSPVLVQNGEIRIASNVTVTANTQIIFEDGASISATSPFVVFSVESPDGFIGSEGCFGGSLTVRFSPRSVVGFGISPDWWDLPSDDDKVAQAMLSTSGIGSTTLDIDIARAYSLTDHFDQPTTAVIKFRQDGYFGWTGAGAVHILFRAWEAPGQRVRVVFGSIAKIASLQFAYDRDTPLTPEFFGAVGDGTSDDSVAVYAAMLHGRVKIQRRYLVNQSLTIIGDIVGGDVDLIGDENIHPWDTTESTIILGDGVDLTFPEDLIVDSVRIRRETSTANLSQITVAEALTIRHAYIDGPSGASDSLAIACGTADIKDSRISICAVVVGTFGAIADSLVTGVVGSGLSGGQWDISRSTVAKVSGVTLSNVTDSSITVFGANALSHGAKVRSSAVGHSNGWLTASGGVFLSNPNVSAPIMAESTANLVFEGIPYGVDIPWNGMGTATVAGSLGTVGNLRTQGAMMQTLTAMDGVLSPDADRAILASPSVITASTSGWTIASSLGTPSIVDSSFYWVSFASSFSNAAISILGVGVNAAISRLCAFGGYIEAEWTGENACVQLGLFASSAPGTTYESSPVFGVDLSGMGVKTQRARWHFWSGAYLGKIDSINAYISKVTGGTITAPLKLKITVVPTAPTSREQWNRYWGGDFALSNGPSTYRYNTWRETVAQNGECRSLSVWVPSLPSASPWTPRPESLAPVGVSGIFDLTMHPLRSVLASVPIVGPSSGTVLYALKPAAESASKLIVAGAI